MRERDEGKDHRRERDERDRPLEKKRKMRGKGCDENSNQRNR